MMKYLNICSNGSKLEIVTWKFTKNHTPSQAFFKEFYHKCRTSILKISWWLLLRKTLFWKLYFRTLFTWMAGSERQMQRYIYLTNSSLVKHILHFLLWRHVKEERIFMNFLLGRVLREKCNHTEIALNIIQKQVF